MLKRLCAGIITLFFLIGAAGLCCAAAEEQKAAEKQKKSQGPVFASGLDGLKIGGLWYLSYQNGRENNRNSNQLRIKRGYINVTKSIFTWGQTAFEGRITPDVTQDSTGDVKVRLKYAYGKFKWEKVSWQPWVEFGLVHTPWFDFEEHVNMYRMQDTMFIERNSTLNSADFGVTFGGFLGPKLKDVKYYPGRYGSFSFSILNGGGYHALENNRNKVIEGRLTVRPFPDIVRGLQFSYFGIKGKGNTAAAPEWNANTAMVSYESNRTVVTGTYYAGDGNQAGNAVSSPGQALPREGFSFFGELKFPRALSLIGRYDYFDPNTNVNNDENQRVIAGFAWNMGNDNIWLFDYDRVIYKDNRGDGYRFQLTLQVSF